MRRVVLAVLGTVSGLVMLLSFKTHPAHVASLPAAVSTSGPGTAGSGSDPSSAAPSSSAPSVASSPKASSPAAASGTKTVTGDSIDTQFGPIQVQVTVTGGRVSKVTAVDYPQTNPRDYEINSYAIPVLNQEATAAGSANIDMVSGATYTSDGYIQSLQSALNKAGL